MAWIKAYITAFRFPTPDTAAVATRRSLRTFLQAGLPIFVAAGTGFAHLDVAQAAALTGAAAVLAFWQNVLGK